MKGIIVGAAVPGPPASPPPYTLLG